MGGRVMIAGTGSHSGKTSIACGLMMALKNRGLSVSACKCGPDYIDPMFHRDVLGAPSRNLDLFLCNEATVRHLLSQSCADADITVIEGVMGFYDGLGWTVEASSCHLSNTTDTPVLLVADCKGKSLTLAAELQGVTRFRPNRIAGIILNRCNARTYPAIKKLVEEAVDLPVLGYLPVIQEATLGSRHLGLVTAAEIGDLLQRQIGMLAEQMEESVELDRIIALARNAPPFQAEAIAVAPVAEGVRIAVADDKAFCFTYRDNLALLEMLGAEIVPFSPLSDARLPENIHGLMLSGGYPELYAEQLAANRSMLRDLRRAIDDGMPTIAECGGFMLLCRSVKTAEGAYPMAGALDTEITMTNRLSRFGYVTLTARKNNLLCDKGDALRAHEFHYSEAGDPGSCFLAQKQTGASWDTVYATDSLYAGYPHLHLWGNREAARRFVRRCEWFRQSDISSPRRDCV